MVMVDEKQQVSNVPLGSFPVATVKRETDGANIQIFTQGLSVPDYDYVAVTYPTTSQEVYTFKTGGVAGTTVGVVTLDYSDAVTKQILTAATRT